MICCCCRAKDCTCCHEGKGPGFVSWTLWLTRYHEDRLAWADKAASIQDTVVSLVHPEFAGHVVCRPEHCAPQQLKGIIASRAKHCVLFYACQAVQRIGSKYWHLAGLHVSNQINDQGFAKKCDAKDIRYCRVNQQQG